MEVSNNAEEACQICLHFLHAENLPWLRNLDIKSPTYTEPVYKVWQFEPPNATASRPFCI